MPLDALMFTGKAARLNFTDSPVIQSEKQGG